MRPIETRFAAVSTGHLTFWNVRMARTKRTSGKHTASKRAAGKRNSRQRRGTTRAAKRTGPADPALRRRAGRIVRLLKQDYPEAVCALNFHTPLELLVATILSAQCTDERVNQVTRDLFRRYRSAADYAQAPLEELKEAIRSTGFFNSKAKAIQGCCRALVEQHRGEVPRELDQLTCLPGVGRKTANVVLGTAMGIASGVVVDTHVGRIARRLGLTQHKDPDKAEADLMALLPQAEWIDFGHRMIHHGRRVCTARKPKCDACTLDDVCPRIGVDNGA